MTPTYDLMILLYLLLAFFVNYGVSLWHHMGFGQDNTPWWVPMGVKIIPGVSMCLMIPFVPETPCYLVNQGKSEQVSPQILINCLLHSVSRLTKVQRGLNNLFQLR